ncbi:MAG: hypothetical protein ABIP48_06725 [Planctomycetota bacterium]
MSKTIWSGAVIVCTVGVALLAGCAPADTGGRLGVSGTVTFEGKALDQGTIEFTSTGEGAAVHTGAMISGGSYSVPAQQGLPPGTYLVKISSTVEDPSAEVPEMPGMAEEGAPEPEDRIPAEYNTESKQEITVTGGGPQKFDFDIQ